MFAAVFGQNLETFTSLFPHLNVMSICGNKFFLTTTTLEHET